MSKHHDISIKPACDIFTLTSGYKGVCACGWVTNNHFTEADDAMAEAKFHVKLAINSEYGREQEKHASTADWHVTVQSPRGGLYTVTIDGLAEAVDYANTMRELGWTLIDFKPEQS